MNRATKSKNHIPTYTSEHKEKSRITGTYTQRPWSNKEGTPKIAIEPELRFRPTKRATKPTGQKRSDPTRIR